MELIIYHPSTVPSMFLGIEEFLSLTYDLKLLLIYDPSAHTYLRFVRFCNNGYRIMVGSSY